MTNGAGMMMRQFSLISFTACKEQMLNIRKSVSDLSMIWIEIMTGILVKL